MNKLTIINIVQWMNANRSSFLQLQSRIVESGMDVPIQRCLNEITDARTPDDFDSARSSLRIALKDGLYFANKELKAEIQKHIKLI